MPIRPVSPYYLEPQMERVVRPFVVIDSRPYDPPAPRQPLPGEEDEAFISWGSASRFISPQITQPVTSRTSFGGGGFLPWQLVRFAAINLKMVRIIWKNHHGR
jgi:hypothetical protein